MNITYEGCPCLLFTENKIQFALKENIQRAKSNSVVMYIVYVFQTWHHCFLGLYVEMFYLLLNYTIIHRPNIRDQNRKRLALRYNKTLVLVKSRV